MLFFNRQKDKRRGVLLDHPVDDASCCRECGAVCCRSFPSVELSWEEYRQLEELGAARLEFALHGPHRLIIENGCEFLRGSRCGIYDHRPAICRRFICSS